MNLLTSMPPLQRRVAIPAFIVLGLLLLPVIVVIAIAFGSSATYQFPPQGFTLRWVKTFLESEPFMGSLFRVSLPLGLATAFASTILGTCAAAGIARSGTRARTLVQALFLLPVVFPQIVLGVGLFLLYARLEVSPTLLSLGIAHVIIATPYVIRVVLAAIGLIDPRLEEAAQSLGAGPIRAFFLVTLPILKSSILSGAIFAFIISFSDVNLALFLSSADTTTLPIQILAQMQYSSDPTIAAASAAQIALISMLVLAVQRMVGSVRA